MPSLLSSILDISNYVLILMLVSLGLAIVFGLMNVINMAHGEFMMLGGYVVLVCHQAGLGVLPAMLIAPVVIALVGLLFEAVLIHRLYARVLDSILATWGLSLILKQLVVLTFGPGSHSVPNPLPGMVSLWGTDYPGYRLFIMAMTLTALLLTFWVFFRTDFGLSARCVIANRNMSACLGINTRRLDRFTFAFGCGLAGLAGAVMAPMVSLDPQMGLGFLVPAFLSILIGGLGSVATPLAGAAIVGVTDNLVASFLSPLWAQGVVFTLAIVLIRLFPTGVVARKSRSL